MKLSILLVVLLVATSAFAHDHHDGRPPRDDKPPRECPVRGFYNRHVQCRVCLNGQNEEAMKWCAAPGATSDSNGRCVPSTSTCDADHKELTTLIQCPGDKPETKQSCTLCTLDGYTWCQDDEHEFDEYAGSCIQASPEDEEDLIGGDDHDWNGRDDEDDEEGPSDDEDDEEDDEDDEDEDDEEEDDHRPGGPDDHDGRPRRGRHGPMQWRMRVAEASSVPVPSEGPPPPPSSDPSMPPPPPPSSESMPPPPPSSSSEDSSAGSESEGSSSESGSDDDELVPPPPPSDDSEVPPPPPSSSSSSSAPSSSSSSSSSSSASSSSKPVPPPSTQQCPVRARRITRFTECGPMKMMTRHGRWRRGAHHAAGWIVPLVAIGLACCCVRRARRRCHKRRAEAAAAAAGGVIPPSSQYPGMAVTAAPVALPRAIAMPISLPVATPVVAAAPAPLVYSHDPQPKYVVPVAATAAITAAPVSSGATMVELRTFPAPAAPEEEEEAGRLYPKVSGNGYARIGSDAV